MFKVRIDDETVMMEKEEFLQFVDMITVFKNYTKDEFINRVFEQVDGYFLHCVQFTFDTKNPNVNIYWKPENAKKSPINLFFFL